MSKHRVSCIRKSERYNPWERITDIGGTNSDGSRWRLPQQDAIKGIETRQWSFFVQAGGFEVEVIVRTSRFGNKYLTTEADGEQPDNLLSLPECS
jgi:hypothetical protein